MNAKRFKTIDEIIDTLERKGVIVEDKEYARKFLSENNYHFVTNYRNTFKDNTGRYLNGTTFRDISNLYLFDRKLRMLFFEILLEIEQKIKTNVMYYISYTYGFEEQQYTTAKNFDQLNPKLKTTLHTVNLQLDRNGRNNREVQNSIAIYGFIPLWIGIKIFTFGLVQDLISVMKNKDQRNLCQLIVPNKDFEKVITDIDYLVHIRNMCAHDEELYNINFNNHKLNSIIEIIEDYVDEERFNDFIRQINHYIYYFTKNSHHLSKQHLLNVMNIDFNSY